MGIHKLTTLLASVFTSLAAACPAQDLSRDLSGGIRAKIPDNVYMKPAEKVRVMLQSFASCLVHNNRRQVESVLELWPDITNYNQIFSRIATSKCMASGGLTMNVSFLRGALYTALYKIDYKSTATFFGNVPIDFGSRMTAASTPQTKVYISRMIFADCVARHNIEETRNFVLAPPTSKDEDIALSKLLPTLGPCIPQGQNVQFDRTILSGILAEALYREARSANQDNIHEK